MLRWEGEVPTETVHILILLQSLDAPLLILSENTRAIHQPPYLTVSTLELGTNILLLEEIKCEDNGGDDE